MLKISTSTKKLHFILLSLLVPSNIVALAIEIVISYWNDIWDFFGTWIFCHAMN